MHTSIQVAESGTGVILAAGRDRTVVPDRIDQLQDLLGAVHRCKEAKFPLLEDHCFTDFFRRSPAEQHVKGVIPFGALGP